MLQVARLAPKLLCEATDNVIEFLLGQINEDGGFQNRDGQSDLYYTVFGLEALVALQQEIPYQNINSYLDKFGNGRGLDLVHLSCLVRCHSILQHSGYGNDKTKPSAEQFEVFRSMDGGYSSNLNESKGNVYHGFLVLGAYQDLKIRIPDPRGLVSSIQSLQIKNGGYAGKPGIFVGSTPTTAAALIALRHLDVLRSPRASEWLLSQSYSEGGFLAGDSVPIPDLLSTATALHALAGTDVSFEHLKESTLDFLDSLWTNKGGFYGNWNEDVLDCEYTYYGLLALGHLSL